MKNLKSILAITILAMTFISCSNDDDGNPIPVIEEEVITTLIARLNSTEGNITMTYRDLDGDGPNDPIIEDFPALAANTVYTGTLDLLKETEDPAESITEEIKELDEEHQFFFSTANGLVSTTYLDTDDDGNPVGLAFTLTTGDAGTDNFTIILRHLPMKDAEGVSDGNSTNAGGETDISATFPIVIE